jgi:hypothetical protein
LEQFSTSTGRRPSFPDIILLRLDPSPVAAQPALRGKFRLYAEAWLAVFQVLPDRVASNAQATRAKARPIP